MLIRKLTIPRRAVLRGIGTMLALPALDGLAPVFAAGSREAGKTVRRLGTVYVPNGMAMDYWSPAAEGAAYELTPVLQPLAKHRNTMTVVSGLTQGKKGSGAHSAAASKFLTGRIPEGRRNNSELRASISMDQVVAKEFGRETQLASLEVGLDPRDFAGTCAEGLCAYTTTIVWRDEAIPLPMENNPRVVFERLFGDGDSADPAVRLKRIQNQRSILDSVTEKVVDLNRGLGADARIKLGQYVDAVRDVERRIQMVEEQSARTVLTVDQPPGIPPTFEEHIKLMFDLQVLAFQSDLTRVITFMLGRETSGRTYPEIGVPDAHHPLSHHNNDTNKIAALAKINALHTTMFAYFLDKMQATPDGEGSLLDNTLLLYGAGMSNSNTHDGTNLPLFLAGGAAGQHRGGRHVVVPSDTPVANLHLTIFEKLGLNIESFGDGIGTIKTLSI